MKKHWKQNLKKLVISSTMCLLLAASCSGCGKHARLIAHDAFAGTEDQTEAPQETVTEAEDQTAAHTEENAASDTDNDTASDSGNDSYADSGNGMEKEPESEKMEVPGASSIFVYICGQVLSPGVYELEESSRICDAVEAAGGMTKEAAEDYWNLAQLLTDGQMIYIPTQEEAEERGDSATNESRSAGSGTNADNSRTTGSTSNEDSSQSTGDAQGADSGICSDGRVNINTAGKETLMTISGIGESRAEAIIAYRKEHGFFSDTDDIKNVSGIGDALYDRIKDYIAAE